MLSNLPKPVGSPVNPDAENKKRNALLVVALGLLIIGIFAWWLIKNNPGFFQTNDKSGQSNNIATILFPVWIAIFIPLMAIKKKKMAVEFSKQQPLTPDKIKLISLMLFGTIIAVFIFVFLILIMGK